MALLVSWLEERDWRQQAGIGLALAALLIAPQRAAAADLSDPDPQARIAAADALAAKGAAGAPAVPALVKALGDADADVRWHAARALGAIGPEAAPAVEALSKALADASPVVRAQAAHALGRIGEASKPAVAALGDLVADDDRDVRRAAVRAIAAIRPGREVTLPIFAKVFERGQPDTVAHTLDALTELGPAAVAFLRDALNDDRTQYFACLVLAQMGAQAEPALDGLIALVKDNDPDVRLQACLAIAEIPAAAQSAGPALLAALDDEQPAVQFAAAYALGKLKVASALEPLAARIDSPQPMLATVAAWSVLRLAPADNALVRRAVAVLVAGLKSDDSHVSRAAARGLVELSPAPPEAVAALIEQVEGANPETIQHLTDALAALGAKAAPAVARGLRHRELRELGLGVLHAMGAEAQAATAEVVEALAIDDVDLQIELCYLLGGFNEPSPAAVPRLAAFLAADEPQLRAAACYALGRIGPPAKSASGALARLLDHSEGFTRLSAAWALAQIAPDDKATIRRVLPLLIVGLTESSPVVRSEIAATLGVLGARARDALPALKRAAADPDPQVAAAARAAIEKIQ